MAGLSRPIKNISHLREAIRVVGRGSASGQDFFAKQDGRAGIDSYGILCPGKSHGGVNFCHEICGGFIEPALRILPFSLEARGLRKLS